MEFKVGASLWMGSQESQMYAAPKETLNDFRKKLAFPEETRSESDTASQSQARKEEGAFLREQTPDSSTSKHEELYSWGLEAGHHLSFSAGAALLADIYEGKSTVPVMPESSEILVEPNLPRPILNTDLSGDVPSSNVLVSLPSNSIAVPENADADGVGERLQWLLMQRWPPSCFSILPSKNGLDVVVRDFYLSEIELRALVKDLRETMRSADGVVEEIWINGRSVWQRTQYLPKG